MSRDTKKTNLNRLTSPRYDTKLTRQAMKSIEWQRVVEERNGDLTFINKIGHGVVVPHELVPLLTDWLQARKSAQEEKDQSSDASS